MPATAIRTSIPLPGRRFIGGPPLFATGAMLVLVAAAYLAWLLFETDGNLHSLKLNEAIIDEASAPPPITGSVDVDRAGP